MAVPTRRLHRFLLGWALLFGLVMLVRALGGLQPASLHGFDLFSTLLADQQPSTEIVLIGINDDDMLRFGSPPYEDDRYVDAFSRLFRAEPAAVIWAGLRPVHMGSGAEELNTMIRSQPRWFIGVSPAGAAQPEIPALPAFMEAGRVGHLTQVADRDNATRRILLSLRSPDGTRTPHRGLLGVNAYLQAREPQREPLRLDADSTLLLENVRYPAHPSGRFGEYLSGLDDSALWSHLLQDVRRADYRSYSLSQLLDGQVDDDALRDRLLVVGTDSMLRLRPVMSATSFRWFDAPQWLSTLVLTAHQIDSLLALARGQARPFVALGEPATWVLLGTYLAALLWLLMRGQRVSAWTALAAAAAALTLGLALFAHALGVWLPWVPALLLCLGAFVWRTLLGLEQSSRERERAGLLQRVIDSLPDPMCVIDAGGTIKVGNRAFGRLALTDQLGRLQLSNAVDADALVLHLPFGDAELHVDALGGDRLLRVLAFRRQDQVVQDFGRIEVAVEHALADTGSASPLQLALIEVVDHAALVEHDSDSFAELAARELTQRIAASFVEARLLCRITPAIWLLLWAADEKAAADLQDGLANAVAWPLNLQGRALSVELRSVTRSLPSAPVAGLRLLVDGLRDQLRTSAAATVTNRR
jgi:CHASE2 domain-containing sensor protein